MDISSLRKATLALGLCLSAVLPATAPAQIQTGRLSNGGLLITDQPLPAGATSGPLSLDQVMTLPPPEKTGQKAETAIKKGEAPTPTPTHKQTPEEAATCRGIAKRYNESRAGLAQTERDKASGKLLIPDSGLVTMRQNLATLERLQALCQQ